MTIRKVLFGAALVAILCLSCKKTVKESPENLKNLTQYVDPFIGTTNFGTCFPGAVMPRGMVSVVPFNVTGSSENKYDKDARWWSTPYCVENVFLTGFSHVNLSGVGCPDLGSILLMPTTGELNVKPDEYGSKYSRESAKPGYYSVFIDKYKVKAEVSATLRSGISRFTFPEGKSNVLLNLGLGLTNENGACLRVVSDNEIEGSKMLGSFCYSSDAVFPVYFVVKFNKKANNTTVWKKQPLLKGVEHAWSKTSGKIKYYKNYRKMVAGDSVGVCFNFDTKTDEVIEARVGVSYVSIDNARLNLEKEQSSKSFETIVSEADKAWNKKLNVIEVEGGTKNDKIKFYTALYHTFMHPNIHQDVNGQYPEMEGNGVGTAQDRDRFTVFSLWDTYRNLHPLMALAYPKEQSDMVKTMVDMYGESGWMPMWELMGQETHVMQGDPATAVIADSYHRGIKDFDIEKAYEGMKKSADATTDNFVRSNMEEYAKKHFITMGSRHDNSTSIALEYYIADWNLAMLAKTLGKHDDYKKYMTRSLGYKNYFDTKEFKMIRPIDKDGEFFKDFNPHEGENFAPVAGFHEGTAWNYTFYVPHDVKGLIKLMGGNKEFVNKLEKVFNEGLYDAANEPNISYPYMFNYVKGEEWRTQKHVRKLVDEDYKTTPDGIPGNDDTGTMSAWLVYSMMGIYPDCPGSMNYALTSPKFDKVKIKLDNRYYKGEEFVIETKNNSKDNIYIDNITLNGKKYDKFFLNHEDIVKGGKLTISLKK